MILVDPNVISEPLRMAPAARVADWLDAQPLETLFLSAITVAELRFGVAAAPAGRRRDALHDSLEARVLPLFSGRVLAFDIEDRDRAGSLLPSAQQTGFALGAALAGIIANGLGFEQMTRTEEFRTAAFWLFTGFVPPALLGCLIAWRFGHSIQCKA